MLQISIFIDMKPTFLLQNNGYILFIFLQGSKIYDLNSIRIIELHETLLTSFILICITLCNSLKDGFQ